MDAITGWVLMTMTVVVLAYAVGHGDVLRAYDRWHSARAALPPTPQRAMWLRIAVFGLLLLALAAAPAMTVLVLLGLFVVGCVGFLLLAFMA